MKIRNNHELVMHCNHLGFAGASSEVEWACRINANTFDVALDTPVYRIFQLKYLLNDLRSKQLTLTHALPTVWNDQLENPLLNLVCNLDGEPVHINSLLDSYYAQCWTKEPTESMKAWESFSHNEPAVRVKTTLRRILEKLVSISCPSYSLHFFAGAVEYHAPEQIEHFRREIQANPYPMLGTLGHELATSVMLVRDDFSDEDEIRILFDYEKQNPWILAHAKLDGITCALPFDWCDVIDEVLCASSVSISDMDNLSAELSIENSATEVKRSKY